MKNTLTKLAELITFVDQLRDPNTGDPWILAQDCKSLITLTIEEAYEFAHSVDENDFAAMCDELGDLLLHVVLYAKLASEAKQFNLADIAQKTLEKQKRRKLYFDNPQGITAETALKQWEINKKKEREAKQTAAFKQTSSTLDNIPLALPSINRALKLQNQAAQVGFDWPNAEPVFEKFAEELAEIKEVLEENHGQEKLTEEVGDLLFTTINLARKLNINPDAALRCANNKFEKRFQLLEKELTNQGKKPEDVSLELMDKIWDQVKLQLKKN